MRKPYSADVRLSLVIEETELAVAQVGFQFLILRKPPASNTKEMTEATLVVSIDGKEDRSGIFLDQGIRAGKQLVSYL